MNSQFIIYNDVPTPCLVIGDTLVILVAQPDKTPAVKRLKTSAYKVFGPQIIALGSYTSVNGSPIEITGVNWSDPIYPLVGTMLFDGITYEGTWTWEGKSYHDIETGADIDRATVSTQEPWTEFNEASTLPDSQFVGIKLTGNISTIAEINDGKLVTPITRTPVARALVTHIKPIKV